MIRRISDEALKEIKRIEEQSKSNPKIRRNQTKTVATEYKPRYSQQKTVKKPKEAPNKGIFDKVLDSVLGELELFVSVVGAPIEKI